LANDAIGQVRRVDDLIYEVITERAVTDGLGGSVNETPHERDYFVAVDKFLARYESFSFWLVFGRTIELHLKAGESACGISDTGDLFDNSFGRHTFLLFLDNVCCSRPVVPLSRTVDLAEKSAIVERGLFPSVGESNDRFDGLIFLDSTFQFGVVWSKPCTPGISSVLYKIVSGQPKASSCSEQTKSEKGNQKSEAIWRVAPPAKPTLRKWTFISGFFLGLTAMIFFLFGRHARPEIGIPMFVGGLIMMLGSAAF
jgi:hypothetical protein